MFLRYEKISALLVPQKAMHSLKRKNLLSLFLLAILMAQSAIAEQSAFLILSRGIIPYHKAAEGVKNKLPGFRFKEYTLEEESDQGRALLRSLEKNPPALIVTVGPEATHLVKDLSAPSLRVFTMILNPETVFSDSIPFPGVSMNYPPATLLSLLKKAFPERRSVGIFFSPSQNADLLEQYQSDAQALDMSIQPFSILSSAEIRSTIQAAGFAPDLVLFIPDQAIIKEKLVNYIIEECLFRKIPAVGFNAWFAKSGALMAFYLDYEEVGRQTAELALQLLENNTLNHSIESPKALRIIVNSRIARKFDLAISEEIKAVADQVIE